MNKVVYIHRRKDTLKVIYVGLGNPKRPFKISGRSKEWREIKNSIGIYIEILSEGLSKSDACELESFIISEYGLENLLNKAKGGQGATGYKHTKKAIENISKNNAKYWKGRTLSKETRDKISKSKKGKPTGSKTNSKPVEKLSKNLILIREYKSTAEATRKTNICNSNIISCVNGSRKSAGGFIWRYK